MGSLLFELPDSPENKPRGKNLFEIRVLEQKSVQPPLITEGEISLAPGQIKALTGQNGAGKTTFFKTFLGELPSEIKHKGGLKIGYLPQETDFSSLENLSLIETIDELAEILAEANNWDFDYSLLETCKNVLFQGVLENRVGTLSGGEKTKLQMLALLLHKSDVLFLDEPTNHIDQQGQALLGALIKHLKTSGVSFVCSSHNERFLSEVCEDGAFDISVSASTRKVRQLNSYKPENRTLASSYEMPWDLEKSVCDSRPFAGGEANLNGRGVYFAPIEKNNKIILAGPNGSGKTTFLRQLAEGGRLEPGVRPAFLPQEWPEEVLEGSLDEMVRWSVSANKGFSLNMAAENFYRNLEGSPFKDKRPKGTVWKNLKFKDLSLGEQRFLWFLAIASSPGFNFLILDEPTNHLDRELKAELTKVIKNFPGPVLAVTHDQELMESVNQSTDLATGKFWLLERGPDHVNDYTGMDKYFEDLPRKAEQAVKQLNF